MEFDSLIKKRASIKKYSNKEIPLERVIELIEAANLAPSPGNLDILRFIVVKDKEKIKEIAQACQQSFIKDASVLVVFVSYDKKSKIMYDEFSDTYVKHHVGAAAENFLLKVTNLGLSTCWVGAFFEKTIKDLLKISDEVTVEAIFPIGYQLKTDKTRQKPKPALHNRIFFDTWRNKFAYEATRIRREDV